MPYTAEISRTNPSCFVFLIDQSRSMNDPWGAGEGTKKKAEGVADAINRLLQNLVIRCSKEEGIRDYYHVSVIGYGVSAGPALGRSLKGPAPAPTPREAEAPPPKEEAPSSEEEDTAAAAPEDVGAAVPVTEDKGQVSEDEDAAAPAAEEDKDVAPPVENPLKGRDIVPISEIGDNPTRLETRTQKEDDGAGGILEREVRFPIWFDPEALDGTPMCQALTQAQAVVHKFLAEHPDCFPPIVINITDGEATDGNPSTIAKVIRDMKSDDGNVIVFNLHVSSAAGAPVLFPDTQEGLADDYAKMLFEMSSVLPDYMRSFALQDGYAVAPGARGFVFNGDIVSIISVLDIGTRPSHLR